MGNNDCQNTYLQTLIKVTKVSKTGTRKRKLNFHYGVIPRFLSTLNVFIFYYVLDTHWRWNKTCIASLHGIGVKRIRRASSLKAVALTPTDKRGRHSNKGNKKSIELIENIDTHIQSFPYTISHYGPTTGERLRYLASNLNILKMYELFREILSWFIIRS